jgi:transcriptional regulator with XRE-family HTH domain
MRYNGDVTPDRLREILEVGGWSQNQLADLLGVDSGSFRQWARGSRPVPDAIAAWLERFAVEAGPFVAALEAWHAANPPPTAPNRLSRVGDLAIFEDRQGIPHVAPAQVPGRRP